MIFSKWKRSLRHGNDYFKLIDSDAYYEIYDRYISRLLADPLSVIRLAVLTDDRDIVLGFSVCRRHVLDYVHVHKDHRRCGIGTRLVPRGTSEITHVTKTGLTIWGSKYPDWKFNPFA